jgi:hypothetical protein
MSDCHRYVSRDAGRLLGVDVVWGRPARDGDHGSMRHDHLRPLVHAKNAEDEGRGALENELAGQNWPHMKHV